MTAFTFNRCVSLCKFYRLLLVKIKHQELKPEACTSGSYLTDLDFSMMKDVPQPPYGSINSLTVLILTFHFHFIRIKLLG